MSDRIKDHYKRDKNHEANVRNKEWRNLSPEQQIERLDARLGKGIGAVKQRAKIMANINLVS